MNEINGINGATGPQPVRPNSPAKPSESAKAAPAEDDTVEISAEAQIRSRLTEVPEVRSDLVARVRAEIEAGTYDTPEKLDAALDALLGEL